ncbi:MAG TPA: PH domain-containing protein [Candidatus Binataceae bacterium]|jgi:uncharacterized membrane protein YdbT with pleckstrin-like domain|nr:PH domain-containing protein [Candidatus Binataceae bacterium]
MRCGQCGADLAQGATFCSRCGTRVMQPRPAEVREYALSRILPSWWHFTRELLVAFALFLGGAYCLGVPHLDNRVGLALVLLAVVVFGMAALARRSTSWSLTSDRLIERRGTFANRRREMELADVRSIEVDQSFFQRLLGLGDVAVASAASAEFLIRLSDIPNPEEVAEMLRRARLKRLA